MPGYRSGDVDFYPSKNNNALNRQPFTPDMVTGRAMVNPHYRVLVAPGTETICDSGAFQDDGVRRPRLQPWTALNRQLEYETWLRWQVAAGAPDWGFAGLVTYDQMFGVDECMVDGVKVKRRGTPETAAPAVAETLRAAEYYASQRHRIRGSILFAAQGINPNQYLGCVESLLDVMQPGDWLAFGGFCIIGRVPSLKPLFYETVARALPLLRRAGIERAHILGVTVADAIREAARLGRMHGIRMSTDSSSAEINSVMGRVWCNRREVWAPTYTKAQKYVDYHPCQLALANIKEYSQWASHL
jgi:hypothetical protein